MAARGRARGKTSGRGRGRKRQREEEDADGLEEKGDGEGILGIQNGQQEEVVEDGGFAEPNSAPLAGGGEGRGTKLPRQGDEGEGILGILDKGAKVAEDDDEEEEGGFVETRRSYAMRARKEAVVEVPKKKKKKSRKEDNSTMCHQCQRNDKGRVVRCSSCPKRGKLMRKRYCIPCIQNWYPNTSEEDVAEACPVCRGNCNCKSCLRLDVPVRCLENLNPKIDADTKLEHCKYLVHQLLGYLKRINDEQVSEMAVEAERQGLGNVSELKIQDSNCPEDERMYCNNCSTSIFDFYRSCPECEYDRSEKIDILYP